MKKNLIAAIVVSFVFLIAGFSFLHFGLIGYGISLFVFLPFILGYLLGSSTAKTLSFIGFSLSFILFCYLLVMGGLEGMICIIMAMPLVAISVIFGLIVKMIYLKIKERNKENDSNENILDDDIMKNSLLPLCILLLTGMAEKQLTKNNDGIIRIESAIVLPYTTFDVYEAIKSVDTLDVEKPFLMKLDLPVPLKCVLEEEKIGGKRVCYFKEGQIIEEVTALEKGKLLKMDVLDYQLTGRTWLAFKEAIYTFEKMDNNQCKMIRTTTYSSELYPRFYWKPLERIGIVQEHEYVFRNLEKDLKNKYND